MKIAVAVVTYNRLNFLKDIVEALRSQSRKPDFIIITNNSSSDGTAEWLEIQTDLIVVTQDNVGSSGGQFRSIHTCLSTDADYIWLMDDDVLPRKDCLENLEKTLDKNKVSAPIRYTKEGNVFYNETISFNLSNPFKSIWNGILNKEYLQRFENEIPVDGITFEGPVFHRSLVEKIGLPEYDFFIYADDSEYFIRAKKSGFDLRLIKNAILDRRLDVPDLKKEFSWKNYYIIRNIIAIDILHGSFWVKQLRPYFYYYRWINRVKNLEQKQTVRKAFRDGIKYISSKDKSVD